MRLIWKKIIKKSNVITFFRNVSVAACAVVIIGIGGCTYSHINGVENILSPSVTTYIE